MWKANEGQDVHIEPAAVPNHTMKYLARDTLAAARRFYDIPENRAAFEAWKASRDGRK